MAQLDAAISVTWPVRGRGARASAGMYMLLRCCCGLQLQLRYPKSLTFAFRRPLSSNSRQLELVTRDSVWPNSLITGPRARELEKKRIH